MQFLKISKDTTLSELSQRVSSRNVASILSVNGLERTPKIGEQLYKKCEDCVDDVTAENVGWRDKQVMLNTMTANSDIYEKAALMGEDDWKVYKKLKTFPGTLRIPESVRLSDATDVLGDATHVDKNIYDVSMQQLSEYPHIIDPSIFTKSDTIKLPMLQDSANSSGTDLLQWAHLPWGQITLFSSLGGDSKDFPCYPEELEDSRSANYSTMPDMIYQYEPWQVYESSGPRSCIYEFDMHRDMWTGDHRDGKCNELIRFCEANCYPEYKGSAVNTSTVTLYIAGKELITGVLTDVSTTWDGPIGLDGWYLHCKLRLDITEVSTHPLNYSSVRSKDIIG